MTVLRTADERFANLEGYAFEPHYTEVKTEDGRTLRIHHVDEGRRDAAPILLMHGNPTWAYLYQNFVPPLVAAGYRVLVPDLVGCGRSDKPAARADYTQARHVDWLTQWLMALDLADVTLFAQDWGGTLGLHLVANAPVRFARVIASSTGMPLGSAPRIPSAGAPRRASSSTCLAPPARPTTSFRAPATSSRRTCPGSCSSASSPSSEVHGDPCESR